VSGSRRSGSSPASRASRSICRQVEMQTSAMKPMIKAKKAQPTTS